MKLVKWQTIHRVLNVQKIILLKLQKFEFQLISLNKWLIWCHFFSLSDAETASRKLVRILTYLFVTKWKWLLKSWKEASFGMFFMKIHKVHVNLYDIFLWDLEIWKYFYFEFFIFTVPWKDSNHCLLRL